MALTVKWNGEKVRAIANTKPIVEAMQQAMFREFRRHFTAKDAEGNENGWWRSHFWHNEVSQRMTIGATTPTRGEVDIASAPYAHKISGGLVRPNPPRKALAIPLNSDAKRLIRPALVKGNTDFKFVPLDRGRVRGMIFKTKRRGKKVVASVPYWILVAFVTHRPDPTAEPDPKKVTEAVGAAADSAYIREFKRANGIRR
jgi:hypothetical protein